MKHLIPLARANAEQAERLGLQAAAARLSVRQLGEVTAAWRAADAETRERIVAHPELFLRAKERVVKDTPVPASLERELLLDMERIASLAHRALRTIEALRKERPALSSREVVLVTWSAISREITRLNDALVYGLDHA